MPASPESAPAARKSESIGGETWRVCRYAVSTTPCGESTVNHSSAYETISSGTPDGCAAKSGNDWKKSSPLCCAAAPAGPAAAAAAAATACGLGASSAGLVRSTESSRSASRTNEAMLATPTHAKPPAPPDACSTRPAHSGPNISHARSMLPMPTLIAASCVDFLLDQMVGTQSFLTATLEIIAPIVSRMPQQIIATSSPTGMCCVSASCVLGSGRPATSSPRITSARATPAHCRAMPHFITRSLSVRSIQLPHAGPKTNCDRGQGERLRELVSPRAPRREIRARASTP